VRLSLGGLAKYRRTPNASSAFTIASLRLFRDDLRASHESAIWIPEKVRLHQRANAIRRRRRRISFRERLRRYRRMLALGLKAKK
jgi:hypothetical protein